MHHIKKTLAEQTSKVASGSTGQNIRGGLSSVRDRLSKMSSPKDTEIRRKLNAWFPNTVNPVIISAPMAGYANGKLAAEVSKAGGFGTIAAGYDCTPLSPSLAALTTELLSARSALDLTTYTLTPLPLAVGFIICHPSFRTHFITSVIPLLQEHSPQAVWLFAPDTSFVTDGTVRRVIEALHDSGFMVMFQVGTVAAARDAVRDGADVLVVQGVDAGGHQFAGGAGVVSLVPEVVGMVEGEFGGTGREVVVVAAGGLVDGRGVAAALALGAEGVVMGTRFLVATEASTPEFRRKLILETSDGGANTVKTTFHDDIQGTTIWPKIYDGRAIRGSSYEDHAGGLSLEENLKLFKEAKEAGDNSRMVTWAGTGVGLVKKEQPAGDIVREVREEAKQRIQFLQQTYL